MRRNKKVGLLAIAFTLVAETAGASIIYNVNVSDGVSTVSGTITTDGALGAISATDITAWSLSAIRSIPSVSIGPITDLSQGALVQCNSGGCGVSATASTLDVVAGLMTGLNFIATPPAEFIAIDFFEADVAGFHQFSDNHVDGVTVIAIAPYQIGTATPVTVPEPATATLLGIALGCLGFACKRVRGRRSVAG